MSDPVTITCPCCGDTHASPDGTADYLERNISVCSLCNARIVYGAIAPKIVVQPQAFQTALGEMPGMLVRYVDRKTEAVLYEETLDPQHAFLLAQSIISMVRP